MTSTELLILGRNDIRSDKFGAAAISYIYKAFGNIISSKEIWPFSDKVNMVWQDPKTFEEDCELAIKFIQKAINQYYYELENPEETYGTVNSSETNITKLNALLNSVKKNMNIIDTTSKSVISYSENTEENIEKIENS